MSFSESEKPKPERILIITSSGGGGLLQAATAKEQEAYCRDPNTVIIRRDVLKDWTWKPFGRFCINCWNSAQIKGDVGAQSFFLASQVIAEYLFWPFVFYHTLKILFAENIDKVIDTQPIGTSAVLRAIRVFNKKRMKQVYLEKVLVDLPTRRATHFFRPIRRLNRKDRNHLKLTTIQPLLEEGQSRENFWKVNCNLSENEVHYEDVYVRQSFKKYQGKAKIEEPIEIPIFFKNKEELQLMRKTFRRGKIQAKVHNSSIRFVIKPEDRLLTVLLGSQPASEATFNYVKKFIQLVKEENSPKTQTHLFVFSADHTPKDHSLFRKIADYVTRIKNYPAHLTIVPFSFQSDGTIAPIFYRSNLTITRSGGQTAMELMCVSSGQMWIHSETKSEAGKILTPKKLLAGIPGWEAENAVYLQKICGAQIVTTETVLPLLRRHFRSVKGQASPINALESTA